ncbi:MAG TPA: hypothetical protein PKH58_12955 [Paludibacteraceae bacterium]|nr:hypothetical protein [Paludibacteraceae bacterium]
MQIIQNTHTTYQPNILTYYKTIEHLPNVLNFEQLLQQFDSLKMLHNASYFRLMKKWESAEMPHPPVVFGLASGAFFTAGKIVFYYHRNGQARLKGLPYSSMSLYLGNKNSKFTDFLISRFSQADWKVIADFSNYCTNNYKINQARKTERKARQLETLQDLKVKLTERMPILEYEQLLDKYNHFSLFEADRNWNRFHWYRKALASWKNGNMPYPPILFGLESGLMFGKTGFICDYRADQGECESKRYYLKTDYRNINHPDFENRLSKFLTTNDMDVLKELGKMLME